MKKALLIIAAIVLAVPYCSNDAMALQGEEPRVIERVIKIEGVLEKPRVIFIVPRAKLWKDMAGVKSFVPDILTPVYPEQLIKEQKVYNSIRR